MSDETKKVSELTEPNRQVGFVTFKDSRYRSDFHLNHLLTFQFAVYKNGAFIGAAKNRRAALDVCRENDKPDTIMHIRCCSKLVYFQQHGKQPVYMRGFNIESWKSKTFRRALIDYEQCTPKDKAAFYDALAAALEETAKTPTQ